MEWWAYTIMIMGAITFLYSIAFFLTRAQIKLRLKCFFQRKGDNLFWIESAKNGKINLGVSSVKDGQLDIGKNKVYGIKTDHVKLVQSYGMTGVILSENCASSIDPRPADDSNALSPAFLDGIIKRVKATALGEGFMKALKIMWIIIAGQIFLFLVMGFIIFKMYQELQAAGITIQF